MQPEAIPLVEAGQGERGDAPGAVCRRRATPQQLPCRHVTQLESDAIVVQVTPQPEDGTGDRRAPLPRTLGPPGRQIERFAARSRAAEGVLDVDVPRVSAIQWPGPSPRSVVEHEAH